MNISRHAVRFLKYREEFVGFVGKEHQQRRGGWGLETNFIASGKTEIENPANNGGQRLAIRHKVSYSPVLCSPGLTYFCQGKAAVISTGYRLIMQHLRGTRF
jgi:hypothetical protein